MTLLMRGLYEPGKLMGKSDGERGEKTTQFPEKSESN